MVWKPDFTAKDPWAGAPSGYGGYLPPGRGGGGQITPPTGGQSFPPGSFGYPPGVIEEYWKRFQEMIKSYPPGFKVPSFEQYAQQLAGGAAVSSAVKPEPYTSPLQQFMAQKALEATTAGGATNITGTEGLTPVVPLTYQQALDMQTQLGRGYSIEYDEITGGWTVDRDPRYFAPEETMTPYQLEQIRLAEEAAKAEASYKEWAKQQAEADAKAEERRQTEMINWYREQQSADLEAKKQQRLAELRANPASWLEYASLSGTTPTIQPWMLPLMPQQYSSLQSGAALPGYTAGATSMSGMPQLTTPSAQYLARLSPAARQQYYGYEKARTGATPESHEWRLWSQSAPSGRFGGLQWQR